MSLQVTESKRKELENNTRHLLLTVQKTRDFDPVLVINFWAEFTKDPKSRAIVRAFRYTLGDAAEYLKSPESITRARRNIQSDGKTLQPSPEVLERRKKLSSIRKVEQRQRTTAEKEGFQV